MKRPEITEEMVRSAVAQVVSKMSDDQSERDAMTESIVAEYSYPMDGFDLAKRLDKWQGWDTTRQEADDLDAIDMIVDRAHREAEKQWFAANPMNPPLPIGTMTTRGEITGVYEHGTACYLIKENGCTDDGRRLIVKFEDAKEAA